MTYRGVFVSLNPRKIPCMAKDRRTAGAPSDRNFKYLSAGICMGELYWEGERGKKTKNEEWGVHLSTYSINKS